MRCPILLKDCQKEGGREVGPAVGRSGREGAEEAKAQGRVWRGGGGAGN
jgi:hypothetical protein